MSGEKVRKAFPHERALAWAAAFLLAVFCTAAVFGTLGVQALTSAAAHAQAATDGRVLDEQMRRIEENIEGMAEEYGFSADAVKEVVNRDAVLRADTEAAAWWTYLLTEGLAGPVPRIYSQELEDAVASTMKRKGWGEEDTEPDPQTVASALADMIENSVFPMREMILTTGMDFVNGRADIPGMVRTVMKLPLLGLVLGLAAAGLIALLLGREISRSLKYYGAALAGAGFTVLAVVILVRIIRPEAMIAEASGPLAGEVGALLGKAGLEAGIAAAVLLAAGYLFLILYRRAAGKKEAGEQAE